MLNTADEEQRTLDYVVDLRDIDDTQVAEAGGKGANLGGLARLDGIRVPDGFCVTTDAFRRAMAQVPSMEERLDRLSRLAAHDAEAIRALSAEIRDALERVTVPDDLRAVIERRIDPQGAYAVRSSATAEDLPTASFAGQQDSYLNVVGPAAVLEHVRRCWASLFTERAVTYRLHGGFDQRKVRMAVVVQRMVFPHAAGVLFTADPVTSNRKVASVEAIFGLGEALVAGSVNADVFTVRDGEVVAETIVAKPCAVVAAPDGGIRAQVIEAERQRDPALTHAQVVRLAELGRRIEARFGCPQDIEWCLVDDEFQIVQSRPITTLFPIPATGDRENHVYLSVGHQQMMTDPMKPLGLSFWQMTTPRPMAEAGGRLFVDVTRALASPAGRTGFLGVIGRSDPLMGDALQTVLERGDFIQPLPGAGPAPSPLPASAPIETESGIPAELIEKCEASIAASKRDIQGKSGSELLDFVREDIEELRRILFDPHSLHVIMAAMDAAWWLNDRLDAWLGVKNAADTLSRSLANNVTSEMGLALLDVADAIRPHPDVVAFLERVEAEGFEGDGFLDELARPAGGRAARDALSAYLDRYGMRCTGEIDITRPRWSERPATLVSTLLTNVRNFEPGEAGRRFEQGRREAAEKERELLERLRALPGGEARAREAKREIDRVRTFAGYREFPKYGMVSRYLVYKRALMAEAERLVDTGVLGDREDIFYLSFQELHDVVRTQRADEQLIRRRKEEFRSYQALTPPRVLTSDGEAVVGTYRREDLPAAALAGLPVSAGTIEGRARVVLDVTDADFEAGDILVTAYTDPSWTPAFVAIDGLVTEVGGQMTHGAVIAREYGVPAVVGVENATRLIRDGQRIRVHGTDGYVEVLETVTVPGR